MLTQNPSPTVTGTAFIKLVCTVPVSAREVHFPRPIDYSIRESYLLISKVCIAGAFHG